MAIHATDGASWVADEPDIFAALFEVRRQVEPLGIRLCCNGARRNAWTSGMLSQMGGGRSVYLLADGEPADPAHIVPTLGAAPCGEIVTIAEQRGWYEKYMSAGKKSAAPD